MTPPRVPLVVQRYVRRNHKMAAAVAGAGSGAAATSKAAASADVKLHLIADTSAAAAPRRAFRLPADDVPLSAVFDATTVAVVERCVATSPMWHPARRGGTECATDAHALLHAVPPWSSYPTDKQHGFAPVRVFILPPYMGSYMVTATQHRALQVLRVRAATQTTLIHTTPTTTPTPTSSRAPPPRVHAPAASAKVRRAEQQWRVRAPTQAELDHEALTKLLESSDVDEVNITHCMLALALRTAPDHTHAYHTVHHPRTPSPPIALCEWMRQTVSGGSHTSPLGTAIIAHPLAAHALMDLHEQQLFRVCDELVVTGRTALLLALETANVNWNVTPGDHLPVFERLIALMSPAALNVRAPPGMHGNGTGTFPTALELALAMVSREVYTATLQATATELVLATSRVAQGIIRAILGRYRIGEDGTGSGLVADAVGVCTRVSVSAAVERISGIRCTEYGAGPFASVQATVRSLIRSELPAAELATRKRTRTGSMSRKALKYLHVSDHDSYYDVEGLRALDAHIDALNNAHRTAIQRALAAALHPAEGSGDRRLADIKSAPAAAAAAAAVAAASFTPPALPPESPLLPSWHPAAAAPSSTRPSSSQSMVARVWNVATDNVLWRTVHGLGQAALQAAGLSQRPAALAHAAVTAADAAAVVSGAAAATVLHVHRAAEPVRTAAVSIDAGAVRAATPCTCPYVSSDAGLPVAALHVLISTFLY